MTALWPAYLALVFVQLFFGSLPVLGKIVLRSMDPMALVLVRAGAGAVLLELLRRVFRQREVPFGRAHLKLFVFGSLGVSLNQTLFIEGLARTSAVNASVLCTSIPVITALLAVLLHQERGTPLKLAGIAVSMAGALAIIGTDGLELSNRYMLGNLMVFLNSFAYSLYMVLSKPMLEQYPPLSVVAPCFLYGALQVLPFGAPMIAAIEPSQVAGWTWAALAAIVAFPTVGAYILNSWALRRVEASVVAVYIYLQPLVATVLGVWVLGERLTARTLYGGLLIFAGVFLVSRARRRERRLGS